MDPEVGEISAGSLDALLASTPYESVSLSGDEIRVAPQADEPATNAGDESSSGAGTATSEQGGNPPLAEPATTNVPGVTPQEQTHAAPPFTPAQVPATPQPNPLEAENNRLNQQLNMMLQRDRQAQAAAENQRFEESIRDLDESEQLAARLKRQNDTLQLQNRYLQDAENRARQSARELQQKQESEREDNAHTTLVAMIANEHGVSSREGVSALLRAGDMNELLAVAQYIGGLESRMATPPTQETQGLGQALSPTIGQNRAVDVPGLENANGAAVVPPKPGSGDLDSLIQQTAYTVTQF